MVPFLLDIRFAALCGWLWVATITTVITAQQAPPAAGVSPSGPLRYHREFVPADRLGELARGHLPVSRERFDQLLRNAATERSGPTLNEATVERAFYAARLEQDRLVDGRAELDVRSPDAGSRTLPPVLPLVPCGIPIREPLWHGAEPEPAQVGWVPPGLIALFDARPATLAFKWSLQGSREALGSVSFALELPSSIATRLVVDVPARYRLTSSHGIIQRLPTTNLGKNQRDLRSRGHDSPATTTVNTASNRTERAAQAAWHRWQLELGGDTTVVLRAVLDQPRVDPTAIVLYRQETQYDVALSGVDVVADLQLRIAQKPLSELTLDLSPSLTLVSAHHGEQEIYPTITGDSSRGRRQIQLKFPTPLEPGQVGLHLRAVTRNDPQRLTRLPRIKPVGLLWQEEKATINVHLPLEVRRIETFECRQFQMSPFGGQTSGETTRYQFFGQNGHIQIQLGPRQTEISTTSGTSYLFGVRSSTVEQQTVLSAEGGNRFEVRGQLHSPWSLDSLSLDPPELLDDWLLTNGTHGSQELVIRLRDPLAVGQPARLALRGRGPRVDLEKTIEDAQLRFVEFPDYRQRQSLISARGVAPHRIQNVSIGTSRPLGRETLSVDAKNLVADGGEIVYDVTDAGTRPSFVLKSSEPVYRADLRVQLIVDDSQVEETFVVHCQPSEGDIRKILLFLSGSQVTPVDWKLVDPAGGDVACRRLTEDEKLAAELVGNGQAWELTLPMALATEFRVTGRRVYPTSEQRTVALLAAPQAESQRGTLVLAAQGSQPWEVNFQQSLHAVPGPTDALPATRPLGSYRYDPLRDALTTEPAVVTLRPGDDPIGKAAWARAGELQSRYPESGESLHQAVYWIEQTGAQSVNVALPQDAILQRILVDDVPVTARTTATVPHQVLVQLPARSGRTTLLVDFSIRQTSLRFYGRISAHPPKLDIPILDQRWKIWLPHGLFVWDDTPDNHSSFATRLLGPLARPVNTHRGPTRRGSLLQRFHASELPMPIEEARSSRGGPNNATSVDRNGIDIPLPVGQATSVGVYSRQWLRLAGWSCFFIGFAARWTVRERWARGRAILLAACLTVCLLLPAPLAPLPATFFWGWLLATLARWTGLLPYHSATTTPDARTAYFTPAVQALIGGCVLTTNLVGYTWATETTDPLPKNDTTTYRVVVPIETEPTASKYVYLPQDFYRRLIQLSHQPDVTTPTWSLSRITVSATLEIAAKTRILTLSNLEVACDLEVRRAGTYVQLPVHLTPNTRPRTLRVDGRETPWQWDSLEQIVGFSLSNLGRYRVVVEWEPVIDTGDNQQTVDVTLPSAPDAELRLVGPANRPPIHIRTDTGSFVLKPNSGDSRMALGCTRHLRLRWPAHSAADRGMAPVPADQLMWMRVRPGVVTADALIKVEAGERLVDRVDLYVDESLRLLSLGAGAPAASVTLQPGNLQRLQVELDAPLRGDFLLPLRFLMANVSGIGSIPVPDLRLLELETRNRWLAVTVDPSMAYDDAFGEQLPSVSSQIFSQQWGSNTHEPNFAVQLPKDVANLKMSTVFRASTAQANERVRITCRPQVVEIEYGADVDLEDGLLFQHRLALPDDLQIHRVVVSEDQSPVPHRWSLDNDRQLNVFLRQPVKGPHQLRIQGTIAHDLSESSPEAPQVIELPRMDLLTAESTGYRFDVLRAPEVAVAVDEVEGLERVAQTGPMNGQENPESKDRDRPTETSDGGRWTAAKQTRPATSLIRNGPMSPDATLRCWRHGPTATGSIVTTIRRGAKDWRADVLVRIEIGTGQLDLVRLAVPTSLARRFEFSSDVTPHVTPLTNNRSLLEIWPAASEDHQEIQLAMRVPLDAETRDVPSLQLVDIPRAHHYVILPRRLDDQEVVWQTSHLTPTTLPRRLGPSPLPSHSAYEVTRHPFRATLSSVATTNRNPHVALCDIHLECSSPRTVGQVSYWLVAPPVADLMIDVPDACEVIESRVDGRVVHPRQVTPGRIAIPLARSQLVRRIELRFTTRHDPESEDHRVALPSLYNLKIGRTLWTLRAASKQIRPVALGLQAATQTTQNIHRLGAIHGLIRVPAGSMAVLTQEEQSRWIRDWYDRYQGFRQQLGQSTGNAVRDDSTLSSLETWDRDLAAISHTYRWPAAVEVDTLSASVTSRRRQSMPTWRFVSTGPWPAVSVQTASAMPLGAGRIVLAILLAAGVLAFDRALQRPGPRSWLARWLHVLAIIAGITICVFTTPSLMGWAVVVLAVLSSVVSSFRSFVPQDSQNSLASEL